MTARIQGFLILGSAFYLTLLLVGVIILGTTELALLPIGKHIHAGE